MKTYPFHPAGLYPGGVIVKNNVVTLLNHAAQIMAQAALPAGCEPGDLYRRRRLFELFPGAAWCVNRPWAAQAALQLVRLERERLVEGVVTYQTDAQTWQPWAAEVYYGEYRQWQLDIPVADFALKLSLGDAIHSFIGGGFPAKGRPGDTVTVKVSNVFTPASLRADRPWRALWAQGRSVADTLEFYAAQVAR